MRTLGKSDSKAATVELPKARQNRRTLSRETLRYVKVHVGLNAVLGVLHDLKQVSQMFVFPVRKIFVSSSRKRHFKPSGVPLKSLEKSRK